MCARLRSELGLVEPQTKALIDKACEEIGVERAMRAASMSASAEEWTCTVAMPCSRAARTIRTAISPRLAMRSFLIGTRATQPFPGCEASGALCPEAPSVVNSPAERGEPWTFCA